MSAIHFKNTSSFIMINELMKATYNSREAVVIIKTACI
jgi:hypothetical protein